MFEKLFLTAGLCLDNYNDAGSTINPHAALVWKPIGKLSAKVMYGQAFRAPSFAESYLNVANGFIIGKENNKAEKIKTYEAEIACQLSKTIYIRVNGYYNFIDNLINLNLIFKKNTLVRLEYSNSSANTASSGLEA